MVIVYGLDLPTDPAPEPAAHVVEIPAASREAAPLTIAALIGVLSRPTPAHFAACYDGRHEPATGDAVTRCRRCGVPIALAPVLSSPVLHAAACRGVDRGEL